MLPMCSGSCHKLQPPHKTAIQKWLCSKPCPHNSTGQNTLKLLHNFKSLKAAIMRGQCQTCLSIAEYKQLGQSQSTINKQIARFCNAGLLVRQVHGSYTKRTVKILFIQSLFISFFRFRQ